MMNNNKRLLYIIVLGAIAISTDFFACMTTFINDSSCKIAVFNKNDKTFMFIPKNGKRRFGNQHKHAHFAIYAEKPTTHLWSQEYSCKQKECGANGNVPLKLSDIQATALFSIRKSNPHSSMVCKLPMIQKKNCHSCSNN